MFKQPWFRNYLGIQPLPPPAVPNSESGYKSMVIPTSARTVPNESETPKNSLFKGTITNLKDQGSKFIARNQEKPSGRRSAAEMAAAKRYEEKRRKEIEQEKFYRQRKRY